MGRIISILSLLFLAISMMGCADEAQNDTEVDSCFENDVKCDNSIQFTCMNETWKATQVCNTGCDGNHCNNSANETCPIGQSRCESNMAMNCKDGKTWSITQICTKGCQGNYCATGETKLECTAGAKKCELNTLYVCNSSNSWQKITNCSNGCNGHDDCL